MSASQINLFIFLQQKAEATVTHVRRLVAKGTLYSNHPASDSTNDEENVQGIDRGLKMDCFPKGAYVRQRITSR